MIAGATTQKYFATYNDLSELGSRKIFHSQLHWCKSQCSVPKNKEDSVY